MTQERRAPRLCYITQWYAPEPMTVPVWIAEALADEGWDVSVLTGVPNYPSGQVQEGYTAWGPREERIDGLRVRRAPLYPSHDGSALRRSANYLSWAVSATLVGRRLLGRADVSLVYCSPVTAALPALVAKVLRRKPFVLLVEDLWPDSVFADGFFPRGIKRRVVETLLDAFVNATYRHAAHVAVISPGMKTLIESRGVPAEKVSVVYNWVDEELFAPRSPDDTWRKELGLAPDDFVVLYAGTQGFAQALDTTVEAFGRLPEDSRAHLVLMGEGVEKPRLIEQAAQVAPGRVHFLPFRPVGTVAAMMAAAEAQLVSLKDDPLYRITMPSKVQASLATGRPVLAVVAGDAGRVVADAEAGVAVDPGDPDAVARAVLDLEATGPQRLRAMGENGRRLYLEEMSQAIGARRLSDLLTRATRDGGHAKDGEQR